MAQAELRLIANSGILVEYQGVRLMVDGIYGESPFFSPPLKEIKKAVFGMNSSLRDVDYILHTHRHGDHFQAAYVDEYAVNNTVLGIYVPRAGTADGAWEDRRPLPKAADRGLLHEIFLNHGECTTYSLGEGIKASFLRCQHLKWKGYSNVAHYAVLLELGERRVLFAADAAPSPENCDVFRRLTNLAAVFVTPIFWLHPDGRHLLEAMNPEQAVLYHLPFAEDDTAGLLEMAGKAASDYDGCLHLELMTGQGQCICV